MLLIIKDNKVIATHDDSQYDDILTKYEGCEIVKVDNYEPTINVSQPVTDEYGYSITTTMPADDPRLTWTIDQWKTYKLQEIKKQFELQFKEGKFLSSLGFTVDCRRYGSKQDKDNLASLISLGNFPIQWKDVDGNFHSLSQADANVLLQEMIMFGLQGYQKKWQLEAQIEAAQTIAEVRGIIWQ